MSPTDRAPERDYLDRGGPRGPQRRCRGRHRRPGRVDVVDEQDPPAHGRSPESAAHVPPPLVAREPALGAYGTGTAKERLDRQLPAPSELAGETRGRMVTSPEAPVAVRGDERDQVCGGPGGRPCHDLGDQVGGERSDVAQPVLLPGGDERADGHVVLDRSAGGGERDPPARALAAARDRPGDGRAAAGAERRSEPRQRARAGRTEGGARQPADDAASRQEQVEEHTESR